MTLLEIDGRTWRTPLTALPLTRVSTARLFRTHYRGAYTHEGFEGYEYYKTRGWLPVTGLQLREGRRWNTWMVDDPVHWKGMRAAVADLPDGRILVAGLGLGLMLHHMALDQRFSAITVIERNPDVVALIRPTLPADPRVEILVDDFYQYLRRPATPAPDGVLWDLGVGGPDDTFATFMIGHASVRHALGAVPLVQFGLRRDPRPLLARLLA